MKTKDIIEVYDEIMQILDTFDKASRKGAIKMSAVIGSVALADIVLLYTRMREKKKQIYMPGELEEDKVVIVYVPAQGATIAIESEPVKKLRPKINTINYN